MHHRHSATQRVRGTGRRVRDARQAHPAGVGVVDAEDDVAQRRLAGAVLAQQAMNLASGDGERDVVERRKRAEVLADVLDFQ